jgi:hypothetical protein
MSPIRTNYATTGLQLDGATLVRCEIPNPLPYSRLTRSPGTRLRLSQAHASSTPPPACAFRLRVRRRIQNDLWLIATT